MDYNQKYPNIPAGTPPHLKEVFLNEWRDFKNPPVPKPVGMMPCHSCSNNSPVLRRTEHILLKFSAGFFYRCLACGVLTSKEIIEAV